MKKFFSLDHPIILDKLIRLKKAKQILRVIKKHLKDRSLKKMKVLDIGCSTGIITSYLTSSFGNMVGIDTDKNALSIAQKQNKKKKLKFYFMDARQMTFRKNYFDIVLCNQVYFYHNNPQKLFDEIYRVLRPGGLCFFSGTNKYFLIKPYDAWPIYYKSYWRLKKLFQKFKIYFYTKEVVSMRLPSVRLIPNFVWNIFEPIIPNFIWILEKPIN